MSQVCRLVGALLTDLTEKDKSAEFCCYKDVVIGEYIEVGNFRSVLNSCFLFGKMDRHCLNAYRMTSTRFRAPHTPWP